MFLWPPLFMPARMYSPHILARRNESKGFLATVKSQTYFSTWIERLL